MADNLLEELLCTLGDTFPYLDQVLHQQHILELAPSVTDWDAVAPWLGFEATAVEDLENRVWSTERKRQEMLRQWKQMNGPEATYRRLASALLHCVPPRKELAERVVRCAKQAPTRLIQTFNLSNYSSQHSSAYHTPQLGTPRTASRYGTPSGSPAHLRSVQQTSGDSLHLLVPGNPSFNTPMPPHSYITNGTREPLSVPLMEQQHMQVTESGAPTPMADTSERDMLCMHPPLVPRWLHDSVNSVCGRVPSYGELTRTTCEMRRLSQRIEQLELEKETAQDQFDSELSAMKRAHKREKEMLERHRNQEHDNAKHFEMVVVQLMRQLEEERCKNQAREVERQKNQAIEGTDSPDGGPEFGSSGHSYFTAKSYSCDETRMEYSTDYYLDGDDSPDGGAGEDNLCGVAQRHVIVHRLCRQITLCMEEREVRYVEKARSKLAAHHVSFLEVNSQLTEAVSQSLESLNSMEAEVVGDREGIAQELRSLQSNLENCRLARHLSWP